MSQLSAERQKTSASCRHPDRSDCDTAIVRYCDCVIPTVISVIAGGDRSVGDTGAAVTDCDTHRAKHSPTFSVSRVQEIGPHTVRTGCQRGQKKVGVMEQREFASDVDDEREW